MIRYQVRKFESKNPATAAANGRYYAYPVVEETVTLADLAKHMEDHNCGFSEAIALAVLTSLVKCAKEMLLEGKNVKIDDLCILSVGIVNTTGGAESEKDFSVSKNIESVKLRARATGNLSNAQLNLEATLKKATTTVAADGSDDAESSDNSGNSDDSDNSNPSNPSDNPESSGGSDNSDNSGNSDSSKPSDNTSALL